MHSLLTLASLLLVSSQNSGPLSWVSLGSLSGSGRPGNRRRPALAMDGERVLLFGGRGSSGSDLNDVWYFDLTSRAWVQLARVTDSIAAPKPRFDAIGSYFNGVFWISCGQGKGEGDAEEYYGDLWGFDLVSSTWFQTDFQSQRKPAGRWGSAGGLIEDSFVISHGSADVPLSDTQSFDLGDPNNTEWRTLSSEASDPTGRGQVATTASGGELLMLGGCASPFGDCPARDFWGFSPASGVWTQYADAPFPALDADLAVLPGSDEVVMVGGPRGGRGSARRANEVSVWSRGQDKWVVYEAQNSVLSNTQPIFQHRMVSYQGENPSLPRIVLMGGQGSQGQVWGLFGEPSQSPVKEVVDEPGSAFRLSVLPSLGIALFLLLV